MFAVHPGRTFGRPLFHNARRAIATLKGNQVNPQIHVFPDAGGKEHILSLLPTSPPKPELAIGSSSSLPPTPESFTENKKFLSILHSVLRQHAQNDPLVIAEAQSMASTAGSGLGSGGIFFSQQSKKRTKTYGGGGGAGGDGAGGASAQGGIGGAGRGGWIHISDQRKPPDWGRIADPEDIFGSVEVDGTGQIISNTYQESGTYRIVTRDGVLGLSDFLREKLIAQLRKKEAESK